MELYDEKNSNTNSKASKIIGICIVILIILMILIMFAIVYLKNSITTIEINAKEKSELEQIIYIDETGDTPELYFPIIKMAKYLGYEAFSGDYKNKSEDKTKCYITNEKEVTSFVMNSNILIKSTNEFGMENVNIDKPILSKNEELYITIDGLEKAFNLIVNCDEKFKDIKIYTMDYLLENYAKQFKIKQYAKNFADKKAILEGMIIKKEDNKYGVVNIYEKAKTILETKYEEIKFLPTTSNFLVKSNGKYGVVEKDTTITIKMLYDEIKVIDNFNGLYLVKQNNTYGIINKEGKVILEPEYNQIGTNIEKYEINGVKSKYILLDKMIPIKNEEGLWGFFNIETEKLTDFKYTGIGCDKTPVNNSYPAVVIPDYEVIVVKKDKHYILLTVDGEELITEDTINSVYIKLDTETEQNEFFMTANENAKTINIKEWLISIGR